MPEDNLHTSLKERSEETMPRSFRHGVRIKIGWKPTGESLDEIVSDLMRKALAEKDELKQETYRNEKID